MKTSRSALLVLLLTTAVMTVALDIDSSSQQHEQNQYEQGQREQMQRGVPAPKPDNDLHRTYPCPRHCALDSVSTHPSILSCPEPRCPEPVCPQPQCPAPVCPPAAKIPPCPNVSCPEPFCQQPLCPAPVCPQMPKIPPCPNVSMPQPVCPQPMCPAPVCPPAPKIPPCPNVSCPQHVCPKTECPKPVSPPCPPPPVCATQPPQPGLTGTCGNCLWKVLTTYDRHQGFGFYKAYKIGLTWHEANATCNGDGAHLGVINSEAEAKIFKLLYKKEGLSGWVSVGYHDLYEEGNYRTVLGGALSDSGYMKFHPGEPNNLGTENCGAITDGILYNDVKCEWNLHFICEAAESKVLGIM